MSDKTTTDKTTIDKTMSDNNRSSSYTQYLPAILRADPFIGRFLLAFERILTGLPIDPDNSIPPGLEETIDRIHTYFDPRPAKLGETADALKLQRSPEEFLPWLASWVGLSLRDDWDEEVKRRFISQIVPLYRQRGTKAGLKQLLELYTVEQVEIQEFEQIPHYFQVQMTLSANDPVLLRRKQQIARSIIDQEKPAHTFYSLRIVIPTMRIVNNPKTDDKGIATEGIIVGHQSTLGTRLGSNLV